MKKLTDLGLYPGKKFRQMTASGSGLEREGREHTHEPKKERTTERERGAGVVGRGEVGEKRRRKGKGAEQKKFLKLFAQHSVLSSLLASLS